MFWADLETKLGLHTSAVLPAAIPAAHSHMSSLQLGGGVRMPNPPPPAAPATELRLHKTRGGQINPEATIKMPSPDVERTESEGQLEQKRRGLKQGLMWSIYIFFFYIVTVVCSKSHFINNVSTLTLDPLIQPKNSPLQSLGPSVLQMLYTLYQGVGKLRFRAPARWNTCFFFCIERLII